jgi:type II secretory pathway pseudopilin PulG
MLARDERGFTLIELLVSMGLSLIVMGSVVAIITVFLNDSRYDQLRDQAQNDARSIVDRVTHDLRSAASQSSGSSGLVEKAAAYDIVFETVDPNYPTGATSNVANQYRVRYCLDSSQSLWRQSQTWTTSSTPAVPATSACPSTDSNWRQSSGSPCCLELNDVTNTIGGDTTRPMFTYGPTGYTSIYQIQEVQVNVITDLNPGHLPGPSPQLTSGVFLRNENAPPQIPDITITTTGTGAAARDVVLNGSQATDPNGQSLLYQWYANNNSTGCASSTAPPPTGTISNGTTEVYDAGTSANGTSFAAGSTWTFALLVTDTQGLTWCDAKTVTIS